MEMLQTFGINPLLLLAQIVNFLILLLLLKKFMYKPILKVLDERREKIAESIKNAEKIELQLQKTEADREKKLEDASKEADKLLKEATKSAQDIISDAELKASLRVDEMMKEGKEVLKNERQKIEQEIKAEISDLVVLSLEKVLNQVIKDKAQKELIKKTVQGIGKWLKIKIY